MQKVVVAVPENRIEFFCELISQLGFSIDEEDILITEEDKKLVLNRLKEARKHPEKLIDWEEAKQKLNAS